jgi:hypothetical protein
MRCKKRGEGKREGINMSREGLRELEEERRINCERDVI